MNTLNVTVQIPSKEETVWIYKKVKSGDIKHNARGDATLMVFNYENEEKERVTAYIPLRWIRYIEHIHEDSDGETGDKKSQTKENT